MKRRNPLSTKACVTKKIRVVWAMMGERFQPKGKHRNEAPATQKTEWYSEGRERLQKKLERSKVVPQRELHGKEDMKKAINH